MERPKFIPLHTLLNWLGSDLSSVIVKAHLATGNDTISKVGTNHGALAANQVSFLTDFGETDTFSDTDALNPEKYLVKIWSPKSQFETFDELRYDKYHKNINKSLAILPPTSSVIKWFIQRTLFAAQKAVTLLDKTFSLQPTSYGWEECDGVLKPSKHLKSLPDILLTVCGFKDCKTKRCKCTRQNLNCTVFCKCQNK